MEACIGLQSYDMLSSLAWPLPMAEFVLHTTVLSPTPAVNIDAAID